MNSWLYTVYFFSLTHIVSCRDRWKLLVERIIEWICFCMIFVLFRIGKIWTSWFHGIPNLLWWTLMVHLSSIARHLTFGSMNLVTSFLLWYSYGDSKVSSRKTWSSSISLLMSKYNLKSYLASPIHPTHLKLLESFICKHHKTDKSLTIFLFKLATLEMILPFFKDKFCSEKWKLACHSLE